MSTRSALLMTAILAAVGVQPAAAQLALLDSFAPGLGGLVATTFDPGTDRVWIHDSFGTELRSYSRTGTFDVAIPRPGESTNDVDVDVAPTAVSLNGTLVPAGSLLFTNGETGPAEVYALDPSDGTILATLVTGFGASHVVGGAWHPGRSTLFLVADQNDAQPSTIAEIDPANGAVLNGFAASFSINFGDIDVDGDTGNLLVVSNTSGMIRELTPAGAFVQDLAFPPGVTSISGIGVDEGRGEYWLGSTNGTVYRVGSVPPTTTTTSTSTSTTTSTLVTTTTTVVTTTTTLATTTTTLGGGATLLSGTKLLVKQKKSGAQRLQLIVRDPAIAAVLPCEVAGVLVIEAVGAGAPLLSVPLDAALWKPIKAKKPEKGCKYRKGAVVATAQVKAGKMLKVIANAENLGVPLATDPRPVRIELRHGDVRHCVEFGPETAGGFKAGKKLLAKRAPTATGCPGDA